MYGSICVQQWAPDFPWMHCSCGPRMQVVQCMYVEFNKEQNNNNKTKQKNKNKNKTQRHNPSHKKKQTNTQQQKPKTKTTIATLVKQIKKSVMLFFLQASVSFLRVEYQSSSIFLYCVHVG